MERDMPKPIFSTSRPQLVSVVFVFIAGLLGCEQAAESDVSITAYTTFRGLPVEVTLTRFAGTRTLESRVRVPGVRFAELINAHQGLSTGLEFPSLERELLMRLTLPPVGAFLQEEIIARVDLPEDIEPQIVIFRKFLLGFFKWEPPFPDPRAPGPTDFSVEFDLRRLFPEDR